MRRALTAGDVRKEAVGEASSEVPSVERNGSEKDENLETKINTRRQEGIRTGEGAGGGVAGRSNRID